MKYEIKEISLDNYELHYKNKDGKDVVRPFKRTVELASKIQGATASARFKLFDYLTKLGKTKKDFIIERKDEEGRIVVDESNYRELEASFLLEEQMQLALDLYKELFGIDLPDLLIDMGIENNGEVVGKLSTEIREIIINGKLKTPSIQEINE